MGSYERVVKYDLGKCWQYCHRVIGKEEINVNRDNTFFELKVDESYK